MYVGDVYTQHVRGSQYVFNREGIFYVHPTKRRFKALNVNDSLFQALHDIKGVAGRLRINEKREVVVYVEEGDHYTPTYAGKVEEGSVSFEKIQIDPFGIELGLLWPGFNNHHGSRFSIDSKNNVTFRETMFDKNGVKTVKKYRVKMNAPEMVNAVKEYKNNGVFFVNEYGHVWFPVEVKEFKKKMYNRDFKKRIDKQWKKLSKASKSIINSYSRETRWSPGFVPVYAGKYLGNMELINREEKAKIIYDRAELDWYEP